MDFEKNDALVGGFIVAALAAFAAALLAVNTERFMTKSYPLSIELERISGIDRGAEVLYRGYKAGEVTQVSVVYSPQFRFVVKFTVKRDIRLPPGTKVLVRAKGFTGGRFLDLDAPEQAGDVFLTAGTVLPVELEPDLMAKANDVLGEARGIVRRLSERGTAEDAAMAVREARYAMAELRKTLVTTNAMMEENRAALKSLMGNGDKLLANRGPELDRSLKNMDESLAKLPVIMGNLEALTADLKKRPWRLVRKGD